MYLYSIYERDADGETNQTWYFVSKNLIDDWPKTVASVLQQLKNADLYDEESVDETGEMLLPPSRNGDVMQELTLQLYRAGVKLLNLQESASLDIAFIVETYRRSGYDLRDDGEIVLTEHENDIVIDRIAELAGGK